jgi:hypothetical protein
MWQTKNRDVIKERLEKGNKKLNMEKGDKEIEEQI